MNVSKKVVAGTGYVGLSLVIIDGLFKGMEGGISDVNRSNKRIIFAVTLMNGKRVLSLSYQEIQKVKHLECPRIEYIEIR